MSSENPITTRRKLLAATGSATMLGIAGCIGGDDEEEASTEPDGDMGGDAGDESTVTLLAENLSGGHDHDHDHDDDHHDDDHHDDDHDDDHHDDDHDDDHHDDDHDDDHHDDDHHDDDHDDDHHDRMVSEAVIQESCGHMEFDDREAVAGGASADEAPGIGATHTPFEVSFSGASGYVVFEADGDHDHDDDHHDDHDDDHHDDHDDDHHDDHDDDHHDDHDDDHHDDDHDDATFAFFTHQGSASVVEGELVETADEVDACPDFVSSYVVVEPDHRRVVLELTPQA